MGFWGNINFFFAQGQDLHPIKIYHLVVCLPYFLKFFVEPFLRNRIFKISTLNPGFSTLKHKNPLKSTIFIHFGLAIWQILTIFHQKKDSGLILTIFFEKLAKNAFLSKLWSFNSRSMDQQNGLSETIFLSTETFILPF